MWIYKDIEFNFTVRFKIIHWYWYSEFQFIMTLIYLKWKDYYVDVQMFIDTLEFVIFKMNIIKCFYYI